MIEYHVDSCKNLQEKMNLETEYGGKLSVRKSPNEKALIVFGHDECIFKQYALSNKSWSMPDGTRALVPKDDGQGLMLSCFQSREFGFGFRSITAVEIEEINRKRRNNCKYVDESAAMMK